MAVPLVSCVAAAFAAFLALPAAAQLKVDITRGVIEPIPIAVSPFAGDTPNAKNLGAQIAEVIAADLESSGLFTPIDPRAFIQTPDEMRNVPRFADWRQIDAQALVTGTVSEGAQGALGVEFRLWDVFAGNQMRGLRFDTVHGNWRRIAHKVADEVYQRLTGDHGYFDTQITYVTESGPLTRKEKRLAIMDQDGADHRFLTRGDDLVLTPRFSPDGSRIAYIAYRGPTPRVFVRDLRTGQERSYGDAGGMGFAPRFSPDGRGLAMTLAQDGNSDIYVLDLVTGQRTRVTSSPAIDTSPSFSPDGRRIAFNSDRAGTPQLYVANVDGSGVQRISFGDGHYGSPVWSPRGDLIAFTNVKGGAFHIGIMRPDGSDERPLTRSFLDDGPSWAPNGRLLVFSRTDPRTNRTRLFTIDITGRNMRELPTPLDASDPDWSPLIP